jgi:dynein heavy chain
MNFDRQLLAMSQEVQHWERLRMAVPYIAMEIQAQREKYRVLRDSMLMVVREYNKVGMQANQTQVDEVDCWT